MPGPGWLRQLRRDRASSKQHRDRVAHPRSRAAGLRGRALVPVPGPGRTTGIRGVPSRTFELIPRSSGSAVAVSVDDQPGPGGQGEKKPSGILDLIERVGNKMPHPAILFLALCVAVIILSQILYLADARVTTEVVKPPPAAVQEEYVGGSVLPAYQLPAEPAWSTSSSRRRSANGRCWRRSSSHCSCAWASAQPRCSPPFASATPPGTSSTRSCRTSP